MFDILAGGMLLILAMALANLIRCKVESALPICTMGIIIVLYWFGFFNHIRVGFYFIAVWFICSLIILRIRRKLILKQDYLSLGVLYFCVVLLIAIFQNQYKFPTSWDELAQWAVSPKYLYVTDKFGAFAGSNCGYPDYPPASAIFQYAWMHIGNGFEDRRLYISMTVLLSVFLVPFLSKTYIKGKKVKNALMCLCSYISVFAFYSYAYTSLTVDCLLGVFFAYIIYLEYWEENDLVKWIGIIFSVGILTIVKESGIIFSGVSIICIIVKEIIEIKKFGLKKRNFFGIILSLINCIFLKWSWEYYCKINLVRKTWNHEISNNIMDNIQEYQLQGFKNYFMAIFNYNVIEDTSQTVFHLGILKVPCIIWIALFVLTVIFLWKKLDKDFKNLYIILLVGLILYIVAVSKLYLTSFGEGEVACLSSFSRYLGTYFLAVYLCLMLNLIMRFREKYFIYILLILLPHITISETFLKEINIHNIRTEQKAYADWETFKEKICKVNDYVEVGSKIHVFNGDIVGSNYALTPTAVASPIWQADDFSWFREFAPKLGYEYVYFDTIYGTIENNEFIEKYLDIFDNIETIMDNGLYEVYYSDDIPKLKFITRIQ